VTGIAVTQAGANPFLWMAVTVLGGAALILGVVGILKLMTPASAKQATPSAA